MKHLSLIFALLGSCLLDFAGAAQQLPPQLLVDETFQHVPKGHYWEGRTANLAGAITPEGYAFESLSGSFNNMPIKPLGPALNQEQDFVIEAELRGRGSIGLYWGGQDKNPGIEFWLIQLNLADVIPQAALLRLQANAWTTVGSATLPGTVMPADWHTVRLVRTGATVAYWVDGARLLEQAWPGSGSLGRQMGLTMSSGSAVTLRRLHVWHHHAVHLAPGLPATLRRERMTAPGLNTEREEGTPLVSADGRYLYFSRAMGNPTAIDDYAAFNSDAFVTERGADGEWSRPQSLGAPINTPASSEYPQYVAPDGQTLLVQGQYNAAGQVVAGGLSRTRRRADGTWTLPEALPPGTGTRPDFASRNTIYCLDASGTVLLRSAALQHDLDNTDLYFCRRQPDGTWSPLVRLPAPINTSGNEFTPFLAPDGKTLYFSSDTHPGYGGDDIFVSTRLDDTWTRWSAPLNLGPAVNSPLNDRYYTTPAAGDYAYFVSDAGDGQGGDIYRLALAPTLRTAPALLMRGRVLDARTRQPIVTAEVRYEQLPAGTETGVVLPALGGTFEATLPAGKEYGLRATAPGYLSVNENIDLTAVTQYDVLTRDLLLLPLLPPIDALPSATATLNSRPATAAVPARVPPAAATLPTANNDRIVLNNVFFVRGKPELLPASFPELMRLAQTLRENPSLAIRLDGHTDNTGDAKDPKPNQVLSEQRAAAVQDYLVRQRIAASRLSTRGYGGSQPVAPNDTEANKARNRRVEFVVVSR